RLEGHTSGNGTLLVGGELLPQGVLARDLAEHCVVPVVADQLSHRIASDRDLRGDACRVRLAAVDTGLARRLSLQGCGLHELEVRPLLEGITSCGLTALESGREVVMRGRAAVRLVVRHRASDHIL